MGITLLIQQYAHQLAFAPVMRELMDVKCVHYCAGCPEYIVVRDSYRHCGGYHFKDIVTYQSCNPYGCFSLLKQFSFSRKHVRGKVGNTVFSQLFE